MRRKGDTDDVRRPGSVRTSSWPVRLLLGLCVISALLWTIEATLWTTFRVTSGSMQPLLEPGDIVLVTRQHRPLVDGMVVVFDGASTFGLGPGGSPDYVKRVLATGGERVACCAPDGRLTRAGTAISESYLYAHDAPSSSRFDVIVPPGRLWLMGDHRSVSADSRVHLAGPGGGTVSEAAVVGEVTFRIWPLSRFGSLEATDGSAPVRATTMGVRAQ